MVDNNYNKIKLLIKNYYLKVKLAISASKIDAAANNCRDRAIALCYAFNVAYFLSGHRDGRHL
jgi:hypothetical protein